MLEMIAMGEHGKFVWSAYGIGVGCLVFYYFYSQHQFKTLIKRLKKRTQE